MPRVGTRSQGVHQTETDQQHGRQQLISKFVRPILSETDTEHMIQELLRRRNSFRRSKEDNSSTREHCAHCWKRYNASIVCATPQRRTCIVGVGLFLRWNTQARKHWRKTWTSTSHGSDWLTIPHCNLTRKANRGARHGPCRAQTENHQARQSYKKAHKGNCTSIHDRFM